MNLLRAKIVISIFLVVLILPCQVVAEQDLDQDEAQLLRAQGTILPLQDILKAAKKLHQGRIVEVELKQGPNRYIYEIEIVDYNGQVWEMNFDAKNATLLSQEQEQVKEQDD